MKIKGLGRHIDTVIGEGTDQRAYWNFRCIDKIVKNTAAIPYCVKQLTNEDVGLTYYDKIGHCTTAKNELFYFEANISAKQFKRLTEMLEKGMNDTVFKMLKKISRTYKEFN